MKFTAAIPAVSLVALALTLPLAGCVVAPVVPAYGSPAGVAYVAPTYPIPGPGYRWAYRANFGWGWYHPRYGWHRWR